MIQLTWCNAGMAVRAAVRVVKIGLIVWLVLFLIIRRPELEAHRIPASRLFAVAMITMLGLTLGVDLGVRRLGRLRIQRRTWIGAALVGGLLLFANLWGVNYAEVMHGSHPGWWGNGWPHEFMYRLVACRDAYTGVPLPPSRWVWNIVGVEYFNEYDLLVNWIAALVVLAATMYCLESNPSLSWCFPCNHGDPDQPALSAYWLRQFLSLACLIVMFASLLSIVGHLLPRLFFDVGQVSRLLLWTIAVLAIHTRWRTMVGCTIGFVAFAAIGYFWVIRIDPLEPAFLGALLLVGSCGGALGSIIHVLLLKRWIMGSLAIALSILILVLLFHI